MDVVDSKERAVGSQHTVEGLLTERSMEPDSQEIRASKEYSQLWADDGVAVIELEPEKPLKHSPDAELHLIEAKINAMI